LSKSPTCSNYFFTQFRTENRFALFLELLWLRGVAGHG